MSEKFPDEDDDILMTRMFIGEQAADKPEETEKSEKSEKPEKDEFEEFAEPFAEIEDDAKPTEIAEPPAESPPVTEAEEFAAEPTNLDPLIETPLAESVAPTTVPEQFQIFAEANADPIKDEAIKSGEKNYHEPNFLASSQYQSETADETIRKSGLAYSAAIILFASIVFTLVLGWFADLLFGTSPWGKVGGIILGAIIGFIQFFRTTSQILKDKD